MEENINEQKVEKGISLIDLWIVLKKYLVQLVTITLLATIAAGVASYFMVKEKYTASAKIIINANNVFEIVNVSYANANKNFGVSLYPSIKDMLTTTDKVQSYLKDVKKSPEKLEDFKTWCENNGGKYYENFSTYASVSCSRADEDSLIFTMSYTSSEATNAVATINAVAYALTKIASETETTSLVVKGYAIDEDGRRVVDPETKEYVMTQTKKEQVMYVYPFGGMLSPLQLASGLPGGVKSWKIYPVLAFVLSFALLYVYFLLLNIFDDTVKSKAEIEEITDFNVIAFIEDINDQKQKKRR